MPDLFSRLVEFGGSVAHGRNCSTPAEDLAQANQDLERRLAERTAELDRTNEQLQRHAADRRQAEEALQASLRALRKSEARLQAVTENLSEGLILADLQGQLLHWNRASLAMHDYRSLEEAIGKLEDFASTFVLATLEGRILDFEEWPLNRVLRGELLRNAEIRIWRRDSDWRRIFSYSGEIIHDATGQPMAFLAIDDITDRRKTKETLRQKEALLHASDHRLAEIMHRMTEACFAVDLSWCFSFLNAQAEFLFKHPCEELLGRSVWEVFPRYVGTPMEEHLRRVMVERVPVTFEIFLPSVQRWLDMRIFPTDEGLAAFLLDVHDRKVGEAEIQRLNSELEQRVTDRTAELESANKELEAFSYSVSHDLRAPLRAIDGFSLAMIEDFAPQLPAEACEHLQTIRHGAQQMGALIDDLLTFSRLSRSPLHGAEVPTGELVNAVLEDLMHQYSGRNVVVRCGDLPACWGDRGLLKQVWVNLLSNAFKYTAHRPHGSIEIDAMVEDGSTVFLVRDNGTGFDMRYAGKLFGVFQRLHRADEFEGTGVGLAIVQRIVQRHGGRVWAEAEIDRGATFFFTLAAKDPP